MVAEQARQYCSTAATSRYWEGMLAWPRGSASRSSIHGVRKPVKAEPAGGRPVSGRTIENSFFFERSGCKYVSARLSCATHRPASRYRE